MTEIRHGAVDQYEMLNTTLSQSNVFCSGGAEQVVRVEHVWVVGGDLCPTHGDCGLPSLELVRQDAAPCYATRSPSLQENVGLTISLSFLFIMSSLV